MTIPKAATRYALKLNVDEAESLARIAHKKLKIAEKEYREAQAEYCKAFLEYKKAVEEVG